jgi:hypothetical protein
MLRVVVYPKHLFSACSLIIHPKFLVIITFIIIPCIDIREEM